MLSQIVVQRTQEIGIRMALGAQIRDVIGLIMKEAMLLAGIGSGFGLIAAVGLARFLRRDPNVLNARRHPSEPPVF